MTLNVKAMLSGETRNLIHVSRFAGSRVLRRESVAEHSFMTAWYAYLIGKELQEQAVLVNMGRLLAAALCHDLDEAIMVDLPRPVKYKDKALKEAWEKLSLEAVVQLEEEIGVHLAGLWLTAKSGGAEGVILSVADLISVASYCVEEIRFGNTHMQSVLKTSVAYMEEFSAQLAAQDLPYKQHLLHVLSETRAFSTPFLDLSEELRKYDAAFGGVRAPG